MFDILHVLLKLVTLLFLQIFFETLENYFFIQGATVTFMCDKIVLGRYVTVHQKNTNPNSESALHFCEFVVKGCRPNVSDGKINFVLIR